MAANQPKLWMVPAHTTWVTIWITQAHQIEGVPIIELNTNKLVALFFPDTTLPLKVPLPLAWKVARNQALAAVTQHNVPIQSATKMRAATLRKNNQLKKAANAKKATE